MIEQLSNHPILLLFLVAATGYLIGSIKIGSNKLGVAAVLFVGLFAGAIDERLDIPKIIFLLGLSLFVYSIGISSGPAFFQSYKKNGYRDITFILFTLVLSGLIAVGVSFLFGFSPAVITGMYAGATTNTPAMAGVIDYVNNAQLPQGVDMIEQIVVGYSFSYPMGILGAMIAIAITERMLRIDYFKEREALKHDYPIGENLTTRTILITKKESTGIPLRDLLRIHNWEVVFGKIESGETVQLVSWGSSFSLGDRVLIIGSEEELDNVEIILGERASEDLSQDRSEYDVRRIFVSNPRVVGRTVSSLHLDRKYDCIISRIRRGDIEMLAKGNTVLELGDRIRFVARRKDLKELAEYFGDSYTDSARVNLFTFGVGIGLGLLIGNVPISIGSIDFQLGYAGGPLIVGLILGSLRRTGPIVWTLPYAANVTIQQIGLILLLATIGVRSGHSFVEAISMEGFWIFVGSAIISLFTAFATLIIGFKLIKIPFSLLMGIVSNQPAILDFALSKSGSRLPTFGYTMMFPLALISKIVIAQILFLILY